MIFRISIPLMVLFISISSIFLGKPSNEVFMIIAGSLLVSGLLIEKRLPKIRIFHIVLLAAFHWYSQLNWCFILYIMLTIKELYKIHNFKKSILVAMFFFSIYSFIRLSYIPSTSYNFLVTFYDFSTFIMSTILIRHMIKMEQEKQTLNNEKRLLSTYDPLTGLFNFPEFYKQLDDLLSSNRTFTLFIMDCTNLKEFNIEKGLHRGNHILKEAADLLKTLLPNASYFTRYAGDEFAFIVEDYEQTVSIAEMQNMLASEFQQTVGIQVASGYSIFPEDAFTKDELIKVAEKKLFAMQREVWLKREEHLLRSEKLGLIGELAAGMAHEIRNPLTTVKGFLQISKTNNYNVEPWYDLIDNEITRMSELTGEFLQFSKPHVSQLRKESLQDCIQRVIDLMQAKAISLGHEIQCDCDLKDIYVLIDKDKIMQVLINLVKNALEAFDKSGIVYLRVFRQEDNAIIEIQDTGHGISESDLAQIFQPFFTTKENGTGLGLPICHKIIQDHGGMLEVESTLNEGTTIRITLPSVFS